MKEYPESSTKWTIETLKVFVFGTFEESEKRYNQRFEASEKALEAALETTRTALQKSEISIEKRFDGVNEFRNQLKDQQQTFITKNEYERAYTDLAHRVSDLSSRMDRREGEKTGGQDVWGYIVGGVGILIGIVSLILYVKK